MERVRGVYYIYCQLTVFYKYTEVWDNSLIIVTGYAVQSRNSMCR